MRSKKEILDHLKQLREQSAQLWQEVNTIAEKDQRTPDDTRDYVDLATKQIEVDRDGNMLAWVLGREQ